MSRALDLARLAADERTPIHEREAAALALAKIVAREGLAAHPDPAPFGYSRAAQIRIGELVRENQALTEIAKHQADEILTLREDLQRARARR